MSVPFHLNIKSVAFHKFTSYIKLWGSVIMPMVSILVHGWFVEAMSVLELTITGYVELKTVPTPSADRRPLLACARGRAPTRMVK